MGTTSHSTRRGTLRTLSESLQIEEWREMSRDERIYSLVPDRTT